MKRTMIRNSFLAAALAGGTAVSAHATVLLSETFDSYNTGALTGQGGWVSAPGGTAGTATSANVSNAQSVSGSNSLFIAGTGNNNEQRNLQMLSTTTGFASATNVISFSFDFFDSAPAVNPYRQYANLQAGTTAVAGFLVSMGLNNNQIATAGGGNYFQARIFGLDGGAGASAYFKLNGEGAPLRTDVVPETGGWVNLRVEISDTDFRFYVNNILSKTVANTATLRDYDRVIVGSGLSNGTASVNYGAYYDNINLQIIPEPSTYAAIFGGLALLGAFVYRRRLSAKK
jgi:hypothetical protein